MSCALCNSKPLGQHWDKAWVSVLFAYPVSHRWDCPANRYYECSWRHIFNRPQASTAHPRWEAQSSKCYWVRGNATAYTHLRNIKKSLVKSAG